MRLSYTEEAQIINNLRAKGMRHPDDSTYKQFRTGDYLYGVRLEIVPTTMPCTRWGETT